MPIFFYLPIIVFSAMFGLTAEPQRVPVKVKARH